MHFFLLFFLFASKTYLWKVVKIQRVLFWTIYSCYTSTSSSIISSPTFFHCPCPWESLSPDSDTTTETKHWTQWTNIVSYMFPHLSFPVAYEFCRGDIMSNFSLFPHVSNQAWARNRCSLNACGCSMCSWRDDISAHTHLFLWNQIEFPCVQFCIHRTQLSCRDLMPISNDSDSLNSLKLK